MASAELHRHLSAVAPPGDDRPLQLERVGEPRDVVGQLRVGEGSGRVARTAVAATVGPEDAELILQPLGDRLPEDAGGASAMDQDQGAPESPSS